MTAVLTIYYLSGFLTCLLWRRAFGPQAIETRAERLIEGERFGGRR